MLCLFIVIKVKFIFKNVIYLESEKYPGRVGIGSTEIFEINLLQTRFVYIEGRISKESTEPRKGHFLSDIYQNKIETRKLEQK